MPDCTKMNALRELMASILSSRDMLKLVYWLLRNLSIEDKNLFLGDIRYCLNNRNKACDCYLDNDNPSCDVEHCPIHGVQ